MSRIKKRLTNIYSNIVRKHIQSAPFATKVGQHSDDNWNIKVFHVMTFQKMNLVRQGIHSANGKQRQISISFLVELVIQVVSLVIHRSYNYRKQC